MTRLQTVRHQNVNKVVASQAVQMVCPKCKGTLTCSKTRVNCTKCSVAYPLLDLGIVALFERPEEAIAEAFSLFHQASAQWARSVLNVTEKLKSTSRRRALLPLVKACNDNRLLFDVWAARLENNVNAAALMDQTTKPLQRVRKNAYGYNFSYLQRDWGNKPCHLAETDHIRDGIKRALSLSEQRGSACVLGMGSGRLGLQLSDCFDDLWGVDSSFAQVLQYHELLEQDILFWSVNTKNQVQARNMVQKTIAAIPDSLKKQAHKTRYLWADALNMPFPKNAFDWVFSAYFSDVKPLPDLIKEVTRVLKPDGYFLHYGPLEYHFPDIEHHYAFDEFRDYFCSNGFEVIYESTQYPIKVKSNEDALSLPRQYVDKVLLLRRTINQAIK